MKQPDRTVGAIYINHIIKRCERYMTSPETVKSWLCHPSTVALQKLKKVPDLDTLYNQIHGLEESAVALAAALVINNPSIRKEALNFHAKHFAGNEIGYFTIEKPTPVQVARMREKLIEILGNEYDAKIPRNPLAKYEDVANPRQMAKDFVQHIEREANWDRITQSINIKKL